MSLLTIRPDRADADDYYFTYINKVPDGEILSTLDAQTTSVLDQLRAVPEARSTHRYAPGKWSMKQVLSHINDTERVFAFRALWFARGFEAALPGFDQDVAIAASAADSRTWQSHIDEFAAIRASSMAVFRSLSPEAWVRRGVASEKPFTVRGLVWITAGHVAHHAHLLKERYV